jgi:glycosyltransferase involved in cell wall biosynthesis
MLRGAPVRDRRLSEKLRVGFDARWYNDSGVGTYVAGLLGALSRQSGVELLVYEDPQNPAPDLSANCVRKPLRSGKYSLRAQMELASFCGADRPQVFHSPFYIVPLTAGCPVVITVHDLIPFLFPIAPWAKQALVRFGYKAAVKKSAHIIAVSGHTARDLQEILHLRGDDITVVHNGADRDLFRPEQQPGELRYLREKYQVQCPYAVAASTRNWQTKNLQGALAVLELARQISGTAFQIAVFGPEEGLSKLRETPDDIKALGHIPAADLAVLFRHAQAFAAPSFYEGFGLLALEAMCCGCPVIASNCGALPEVIGNGGQVFAPRDIAGMAHAVAEILCRTDVLQTCRRAGLRRALDFSWERAERETLRDYHRVAFGEQPAVMLAAAE